MSPMTFAIPSKGRLKEQAGDWLADCGFRLRQRGGARGYQADLKGLPEAQILLLSAREIAQGLIDGAIHIGVTGEDLLEDLSPSRTDDVDILKRLGFGRADVVVAVPQAWLDVDTMADLDAAGALFRHRHARRLRVATKYHALTRRFFAARGVSEYRLVDSAGATEAAPAAGSAELIVDITSTGATLAANHLKVLDDGLILQSEAVLGASLRAEWGEERLAVLGALLGAVEARDHAASLRQLTTARPIPARLGTSLGLTDIHDKTAYCPASEAVSVARALSEAGLDPIAISEVTFLYRSGNRPLETFLDKIMATS